MLNHDGNRHFKVFCKYVQSKIWPATHKIQVDVLFLWNQFWRFPRQRWTYENGPLRRSGMSDHGNTLIPSRRQSSSQRDRRTSPEVWKRAVGGRLWSCRLLRAVQFKNWWIRLLWVWGIRGLKVSAWNLNVCRIFWKMIHPNRYCYSLNI